jgi:predicted Zn-dependent peptidase
MRARTYVLIALMVALAGSGSSLALSPQSGQSMQPPSTKGVAPKGKAPVSDQVLQVKLPRPQEADLPNGLHLMVLEDRRVPQVSFNLFIPGAGGYYDPEDHAGLASITAALMREGTATRTSLQISEQLETMAASLGVGTGMSSVEATVSGSALTEHVDRLFELTADVLLNPSFPQEELDRYKQRTQAQLTQQRANPGFLASEMFSRVMYGSHAAGRVSLTREALGRTTREALVQHHTSRYVPDHAVLAIAGDISIADAKKLVEARLGGWKKAGTPAPKVTEPPDPGAARISFVARPNSVQTNLRVGAPGINRTHADYDVLEVMNKVIGGGPTGRLFIHLREDKGYTYGAYSGLSAPRWRGVWNASTDVRSEVTEPALRDLLAEVARMRTERVPDKEFRDQKRSMVAAFALSLESPQQLLSYHITRWMYKLPADYWDKYPERIMAVTQQQVQAAAKKYLDPSRLQIVAVGDPSKADVLKGFGKLETYDTEGRRISSSTN